LEESKEGEKKLKDKF